MSSRTRTVLTVLLVLLLHGELLRAQDPRARERGFPLIQTYDLIKGAPTAESQNFDVTVDRRGAIVLANLGGVVLHDGAWWKVVPVGKALVSFRVATDASGGIVTGGNNELGYLDADANGNYRFVSLLNLLPADRRNFGQIIDLQPFEHGFLFLTTSSLFFWDGNATMTIVADFPGVRPYASIARVGEAVYFWTNAEGLRRIENRRAVTIPGGEVFKGRRVDVLLPASHGLLVSIRNEGLFRFDDGVAQPFAPEATKWAVGNKLRLGTRLPDGRWALGSLLDGVMLLAEDGTISRVIDTAAGLPDDFVTGLVVDGEGSLWVALNTSVARIEVASPISILDARSGLKGSAYTVIRHKGELWVGGSAGLSTTAIVPGADDDPHHLLHTIPALPTTWSLASVGDDLLIGNAYGVTVMRNGATTPVANTDSYTAYTLVPSKHDPSRVWVGFAEGLGAVRRGADGVWTFEGVVPGVTNEVRTIVESPGGELWCGIDVDGHIRVDLRAGRPLSEAKVRRFPSVDGAAVSLFAVEGRILAIRGDRVLRLHEATGKLEPDPALQALAAKHQATALAEDTEGNLWINGRPPIVAVRHGDRWTELRALVDVPAQAIEQIYVEPDGVVWMAADEGLFRHAGSFHRPPPRLPAPVLSRVAAADQTLFGGAPVAWTHAAELRADTRRLRIEYAPLTYRAGIEYQTRLEPLEEDWGAWTTEAFTELSAVPPGSYTFHVRSRGPSGELSPETTWSFVKLPPWYRTPLALLLWVLLAIALVRTWVHMRSRALRQRAERLEARVASQTMELQQTVEELRQTQSELESANAQLEAQTLHDDLTGIANRRYFRRALEHDWLRAIETSEPLSLILLDLDHFKQLNDTHGHPAGDACLRQVSRFLAQKIRRSGDAIKRSGDVVSRYGGEEFAILLAATTAEHAMEIAESLRSGIERLPIPFGGITLRMTASCGVASMVPTLNDDSTTLIDRADRALYAAKAEGRNRVSYASEADDDAATWMR